MIMAISTRTGDAIRFAWLLLACVMSIIGQERNTKIRIVGVACMNYHFRRTCEKPSSLSIFAGCSKGLPKAKAASAVCEKRVFFNTCQCDNLLALIRKLCIFGNRGRD